MPYFGSEAYQVESAALSATILDQMQQGQPPALLRTVLDMFLGPNQGPIINEASPPHPRIMSCQGDNAVMFAFGACPDLRTANEIYESWRGDIWLSGTDGFSTFIFDVVRAEQDWLQPALRAEETRTIWCIGFSYGGMLATMWANIVQYLCPNAQIKLQTFGSPRTVVPPGPRFLERQVSQCRWMTENDAAPYLPPHFSESPLMFLATGQNVANALNNWQHIGPGAVITRNGTYRWAALPPTGVLPTGAAIGAWAVSFLTGRETTHSIGTYRTWLQPWMPRGNFVINPERPFTLQFAAAYEVTPVPPIPADANLPAGVTPQRIKQFDPATVLVRQANPFYAAKIGKIWWVYHWDDPVVSCRGRKDARTQARQYNSIASKWNRAEHGDQYALLEAIRFEMPQE